MAGLSACAQTLLNSWENSTEGWTILESAWTSTGFSTTTGVTAGSYSWNLTATGVDYGPALQGPSSTNLTTLLTNAASVKLDVLAPTGNFGWGMQWDLVVNQPDGMGSVSVDGYNYDQSPVIGTESTLTFTIPSAIRAALAAHPTNASYLTFQIGGGGGGTLYMDNLRVWPLGLINSWENSLEGWTVTDTNWTSDGFSTTTGVTSGTYSWELTAASETYGKDALTGPSSTALTALLGNASSITLDVDVPTAGSFGWWMQCDMWVNQPGGVGSVSLDDNCYCQYPPGGGGTAVLTFPVSQSVRSILLSNPSLPTYLTLRFNGGGQGTLYFDDLQATLLPPAPAQLWVRELWDDLSGDENPTATAVKDDSSSVGFVSADPWVPNPAESGAPGTPDNTQLMQFRAGFSFESSIEMGLPGSLDGTLGCLVQQNNGFGFFPASNGPSFWTEGDFMTRPLAPDNFINFQAVGEYWFSMTIGNSPTSGDAQYVVDPASGAGGIGFADGDTTAADFVAVGVTGLNIYFGPTNAANPFGETNASKAVYISQGTLNQPGNPNSTVYNPTNDPDYNGLYTGGVYTDSPFSQTNFTSGPYHINAFGSNTVGNVEGDGIVVLGHLKTLGGGGATLDAKYYTTSGGNSWNYNLDTNTSGIVWDCSYSFNFGGTMTEMLLFENGQFPFYIYGFRAGTNLSQVVGLDPGRIAVEPLANTYAGYPINMTNLAVEAYPTSWGTQPNNYGTLTYQWYQNGSIITGATDQNFNIANAATNDPAMPANTDAGTYTCVATDPSGTWGSVTNSTVVTVTRLLPPLLAGVQMFEDRTTFQLTFNEPNLIGVDDTNNYVFSGGVAATNVTVLGGASTTVVQIQTTTLPLGTRITLTVSGITNVVGGVITTTNDTFWTDLIGTGVVNWDAWVCPASESDFAYYNTFLPGNPHPPILTNMTLTSWEAPSSGVNLNGGDGVGCDFGDRTYGWFIPPVTTNYVFFISCDDGGRLSLSTNEDPANLCVIAVESDWSGMDQWTNICDQYPSKPHRGDGTASGVGPSGYVWDNSIAAQSPATACDQNRSDQFIVAYYDSSGLTSLPGEPAGANDQTNWASAESQVSNILPPGMTNFWPHVDANGQALISLTAGQKYFMQLEHNQNTGGYDAGATYKIAGEPDPLSPSATVLTGANIAGLVPFTPTISIAESAHGPVITYTGVLLAGTTPVAITNQVAISSNGPSEYIPPLTSPAMFYKTSE